MRRLFKWIFRLIALVIVSIIALLLFKDSLLKAAVERQIRAQTGMDVKIGKFSLGLFSPVVTMQDCKLYNTAEFGGASFLHVRELHVEYDRSALAYRELHIKLMRLDLAELSIVKNSAGRTNLSGASVKLPTGTAARSADLLFTGIDVLNLSVGKLRFLDMQNPARSREVILNLRDQMFPKVKAEGDLYGILTILYLRSGGGFGRFFSATTIPIKPLIPIHQSQPDDDADL